MVDAGDLISYNISVSNSSVEPLRNATVSQAAEETKDKEVPRCFKWVIRV
ncbi:MAG: hypothetical protein KKD01_09685 [Proteobacteria bacterium]|nr:hypothetical protein [Pseudomonadota bacterium]MBU1139571.1 hypothetical protein [Pseudomonadota bacterium]MBU1233584.1 hypothetical protein [Pseudomonadota bacterium]MBU1420585.1 hypothetical protein [Pseudomonadota bacterium]MBU1454982.1 hypothetical protein [Pseudomonadota bacterium]